MIPEVEAVKAGGVYPEFFIKAVQKTAETEKKGRPVFKEVEYVRIFVAGDNKNIIEKKVSDIEKQRWPAAYKAFQEKGETPMEGTPLEEWPLLSVSQVATLKAIHVKTVEQLASMDDNAISNYGMGGGKLRDQAQAFIDISSGSKDYAKLASENKSMKTEMAELKKQLKTLNKKLEAK